MTTRRGVRRGWHLGLASLMLLAACAASIDVTTTTARPATVPTSPPRAPATTSPATIPITTAPGSPPVFQEDPNRPPQPFDEALSAAISDIEAFWRTTFPPVYRAQYTDLRGGIWPVYPGARGVPGCGQPQTRYTDIKGNAFYCPDGDFVAFDDNDLFPRIYQRYGVEVLAMIVAHEWGHAIQNRAGVGQLPTIVLEQQADCFAGAWMGHLAAGNGPIVVNDDTLKVAFAGMITFSDSPGTTSNVEGAHGSGFDRVGAFQDGFSSGASQCATYQSTPPPVIELPFQTQAEANAGGNLPYADIVPMTIDDLDRFWSSVFAAKGAPYHAPSGGVKPYPAAGPYPSCPSLSPDQAFVEGRVWYCPDGDYIAYNQDALSTRVYEIGDFAVSVLLGNAWSDAMQTQLGLTLSGKERSLESDCLTGGWTHTTLPNRHVDPKRTLTLSAGDLDEGVIAFLRFGAGEGGGGTDQVGTVFERVASFRKGILQGVNACGLG